MGGPNLVPHPLKLHFWAQFWRQTFFDVHVHVHGLDPLVHLSVGGDAPRDVSVVHDVFPSFSFGPRGTHEFVGLTWQFLPYCCVRFGSRENPSSQPPLRAAPRYREASARLDCRSGVKLKRTLQMFITLLSQAR